VEPPSPATLSAWLPGRN